VKVIGIDTSAKTGSVALCDGDRLVAEVTLDMERTHSERLMPALDAALKLVGWEIADAELIAVATGPGSFTGLRVGVTTSKSLAFALGVPAVGVPTFDAIAHRWRYRDGELCILLDARKQEVYAARYQCGDGSARFIGEFRCLPVDDLLAEIEHRVLFVGDGVPPYRDRIGEALGDRAVFADAEAGMSRASAVAWIGAERADATPADAHDLAPLYIRRPEAIVRASQ